MDSIQKIKIIHRYTREDGLAVIDANQPSIPFQVKDFTAIIFPPAAIGGNHIHQRSEVFLPLDAGLVAYWVDQAGHQHHEKLHPLELAVIKGMVPHAVKNVSTENVTLLEYADDLQGDFEAIGLID